MKACACVPFTGIPHNFPAKTLLVPSNPVIGWKKIHVATLINNNNNNNNNNKYKTYIAHIQYKYFHIRITDDKIKKVCMNKPIKKLS